MILGAGGFTIRLYRDDDYDNKKGIGRAWIMPHDVGWKSGVAWAASQCYIVANGYGLGILPITRIVALHLNHAYYHKVELRNNKTSTGNLWINKERGYLVGRQEAVLSTKEIDLQIKNLANENSCSSCENETDDLNIDPNGDYLCEDCWTEVCCYCNSCNGMIYLEDSEFHDEEYFCIICFERKFFHCENCNEYFPKKDRQADSYGSLFCINCFGELFVHCYECDEPHLHDDVINEGDELYCPECYTKAFTECEECGDCFRNDDVKKLEGRALCPDCYETATETEEVTI